MTKIGTVSYMMLFLCMIFSCENKEKEITENETVPVSLEIKEPKQNNIPDSIKINSIFIHKTPQGFTRIWMDSKKKIGKYFYSDTLNVFNIARYNFDQNLLKKSKQIELYRNEWSYLQIDSASLKKKIIGQDEYLFLTLRQEFMGKAIPDRLVLFYLLNLNDIDDHSSMAYAGYSDSYCEGCIKGDFSPAENYPKNKKAWQQFQQYAHKSKFISQAKGGEKNISYFKNYEQKWEKDNQADNHYGAGYGIIPESLQSTYYKDKLFDIDGSDIDTIVENKNYIVGTYFRGNLLGYDKNKKLYFPVIVESCAYSCNKTLRFLDDHTLQITYEDEKDFEIKLDEIIFKK